MTRSLNVTPKTTLRSGKSEVTIIKDSARVINLSRLTTNGHKASRGLSVTAELLVPLAARTEAIMYINYYGNHDRATSLLYVPTQTLAYVNRIDLAVSDVVNL